MMIPLSVLDLSPIVEGGDAAQSFRNCCDLARHAETLGLPPLLAGRASQHAGIASAATADADRACAAGHRPSGSAPAGSCCRTIAAGDRRAVRHPGVALPGPDRPGARAGAGLGPVTARALRRNLDSSVDQFPQRRGRADGLFRRAQPRPAGPRRARRRTRCAGLDPGLEPVRRPAGGGPRACPSPSPRISRPRRLMQAIDIYRQSSSRRRSWSSPM